MAINIHHGRPRSRPTFMKVAKPHSRTSCSILAAAFVFTIALAFAPAPFSVKADEGHNGAEMKKGAAAGANAAVASVRTAERNLQTPAGQFRVRLRQSPADPRAGEETQFVVEFSEQVEGGFGGSDPQPIEGANVTARVTTAAGQSVADKIAAHAEGAGSYGVHYEFGDDGDYKIIFDVRMTGDNRGFAADFPVTVVSAPVNWTFWLGLAALTII
ncbi:MAG: FixH family protein, partial [Acidobacteria bacterium]|nr:FixH family protein [Acidobacteriota bacterium]